MDLATKQRPAGVRPLTRVVVILFLALAVGLLLEVALRATLGPVQTGNVTVVPGTLLRKSEYPGLRYVFKPGASAAQEFGSDPRGYFDPGATLTYRINSLGFRGPEVTKEKPAGVLRIAALGDSILFGTGVRDGDMLTAVLQRLFTEEGRACEVLNFAVPTYDTFEESLLLRRVVLDFEPDLVFFLFFLNDTNAEGTFALEALNETGEKTWLRRVSVLYDHLVARGARQAAVAKLLADYRRGFTADAPGLLRAREALQKAKEVADRRHVQLVLVIFPLLYHLEGDYPLLAVHETIAACARELGYPVLDLLPAYRGQDGPSLWIHPANHHPNEIGHAIAARAIHRFLVENGLVGERPH